MDDLIAFLRARLDEDEQAARAATQGKWVWSREFVTPPGYHHRAVGPLEPGDAAFIARHWPERALAEVDAKRRLVELHEPVILHADGGAAYFDTTRVCRSCEPPKQFPETAYPCATLRLLALPYAKHPDYREEWRP
ncbi:DUF6221 family protein [Streptomyces cinereoruber]|uniref:DUF6221 family protein n=1 Tax=Streptomyces cinereoruber TaxID=67260 RepID=UPI003635F5AF